MRAWVIYNTSSYRESMLPLINRIVEAGRSFAINIEAVENTELITVIDNKGRLTVKNIFGRAFPDFILCWDKDSILAKNLELQGIPVFNSGKAIAICDNKTLTYNKLSNNGVTMPRTIYSPFLFFKKDMDDEYIKTVIDYIGFPMIIKENYGSFGMQVNLVKNIVEMKSVMSSMDNRGYLFQEFIESSIGRDIRVVIIGDEILGAMLRENSSDFRANIAIGGSGRFYKLNDRERELALKAHRIIGLDFSGVDLLFGENDEPILCEINSNLHFLGYERCTGQSVAEEIIKYCIDRVR